MSMKDGWIPTNGDRIKRTSGMADIVILQRESSMFGHWHAVTQKGESHTMSTEQMLKDTCEWLPWPHQIIDHIVAFYKMPINQVLYLLANMSQYKREMSFEELCLEFLRTLETEAASKELRFSTD